MTDENLIQHDDDTGTDDAFERGRERDRFALEVVFLAVIAALVVAALLEATTYSLVSSRTPFVIMVPLLGLIVFQVLRLTRSEHRGHVRARLLRTWAGQNLYFNKVLAIVVLSVVLLGTIVVFGHYPAIALFIFYLTRVLAKEQLKLSLIVAVVCTVLIYLLFEIGFDIELYRGLIVRYFQGYRVF